MRIQTSFRRWRYGSRSIRSCAALSSCGASFVPHFGGRHHLHLSPRRGRGTRPQWTRTARSACALSASLGKFPVLRSRRRDTVQRCCGAALGRRLRRMHYSSRIRSYSMSRRTISSAAALLKQHGFKIVSTDVGGARHRKIYLELWNGDVWVQRGRPTPLISREAGGMVAKRIMSSSPSRGDRMSEWPSRNLAAFGVWETGGPSDAISRNDNGSRPIVIQETQACG